MKLRELLATVESILHCPIIQPSRSEGFDDHSHACQPGDLFIGMPGTRVDGGEFWESAIASGAVAALISPKLPRELRELRS